MVRPILLLLFALLSTTTFLSAQTREDMAGEWVGYITQKPRGLAERYFFRLNLEVQDDQLSGEAQINMEDSTHILGVMDLVGEWDPEGSVEIRERGIKRQNLWSYAYWCIKEYKLRANWVKGVLMLNGPWFSNACAGSSGWIHLERRLS
ncbi:MAG: hypothetical protein RLZZ519_3274 [Bacteroidota bacterium]|jgi:hypothetical protein